VGIEHFAAFLRENQAALVFAKIEGLDKTLVLKMVERTPVSVEVRFGHDAEGADSGQGAARLAVQLVNAVAMDDQLALLAARQVEVVHQGVARVVIIPVAVLVYARPFLIAVPLAVLARIVPSSVRHRPSFARTACAAWVVREDALAVSARGCSGKREAPGRVAAAISAWSVGTRLGAAGGARAYVRLAGMSTAMGQQSTGELLAHVYASATEKASSRRAIRARRQQLGRTCVQGDGGTASTAGNRLCVDEATFFGLRQPC
jgi:hypothetical protein